MLSESFPFYKKHYIKLQRHPAQSVLDSSIVRKDLIYIISNVLLSKCSSVFIHT